MVLFTHILFFCFLSRLFSSGDGGDMSHFWEVVDVASRSKERLGPTTSSGSQPDHHNLLSAATPPTGRKTMKVIKLPKLCIQ